MIQFAMIFPGQGSQYVGMLAKLAMDNPIIESTFKEASNELGYDLWQLTQHGPAEVLNKTSQTQPALLSSSVAIYRLWQQKNSQMPIIMAGHSLGEYTALVCSGVINFNDAIKLVELRGRLMQEAVPVGVGSMKVIIGLNYSVVCQICKEVAHGQVVSPVNFNSPDQIVIAGHKEAVERAGVSCKSVGAKRILSLPISIPSHCELMRPAAEKLAIALQKITFNTPAIPVVNNVDVKCETSPEAIRNALVRQLYNPVRWIEIIEFIASQSIVTLLEIGPGKVLAGLTKCIINNITVYSVNDPTNLSVALKKIIL